MTKLILTVFAVAALSTASVAAQFSQSSNDNAGFTAPYSDHQSGERGGDRGGR